MEQILPAASRSTNVVLSGCSVRTPAPPSYYSPGRRPVDPGPRRTLGERSQSRLRSTPPRCRGRPDRQQVQVDRDAVCWRLRGQSRG